MPRRADLFNTPAATEPGVQLAVAGVLTALGHLRRLQLYVSTLSRLALMRSKDIAS